MTDSRPVLFVTNLVAPDRVGAFAALHAQTGLELALFGGRSHHASAAVDDPGVPHRHVSQRGAGRLAASGRYRAVVCGTAGRVALPAAYLGARRAGVPFVLWSAMWAHLGTPAHLAARPLMTHLYRHADHVVTYGEHVTAFARAQGARHLTVAPQAVDNAFWSAPSQDATDAAATRQPFVAMFVGRPDRAKGLPEVLAAWKIAALDRGDATLVLVGAGVAPAQEVGGVHVAGPQDPHAVRNFLQRADVLVLPSVPTRSFREPWGLIANEAMNCQLPIIATDAVGAVAGGLVRDGRNGLVVPAGDVPALARALRTLHDDAPRRRTLGVQASRDVAPYTYAAWAGAFAGALTAAGAPPRAEPPPEGLLA